MAKVVDVLTPCGGKDLTGAKFGLITIIEFAGRDAQKKKVWRYECQCGTSRLIRQNGIMRGGREILSCGCLTRKIVGDAKRTHGLSKHRIHNHWHWMKQRCNNANHADYPRYGGRGIKVMEPWQSSFESFYSDMISTWATGLTIERKDVNGNYCKENCCWATRKTQGRNKRNTPFVEHMGNRRAASEWDEVNGFPTGTTYMRIEHGWSSEDIVSRPKRKYTPRLRVMEVD